MSHTAEETKVEEEAAEHAVEEVETADDGRRKSKTFFLY